MDPTDIKNPNYFHKVVDCQWACPAHTDVPEYIRLIAQGRFTDAYMLNRISNVFPGVLGRTCDRPCEPACRRGRLPDATNAAQVEKPVAICRLKRVAADFRDDVQELLPKVPAAKNGKRIALIGCGPASLTVANDLLPLGYQVTLFEKLKTTGGLMRTNIPTFRLPAKVLDEEIKMITDMGLDLRLGTPVQSMRQLLAEGYDAVFVGSGAPRGRDLDIPGRRDGGNIHIGIDWLQSVSFGHIDQIESRVVIIGAGNTAMDCCRTARRLGGQQVKVVARKPAHMLKASDWELEEAIEEQVELLYNLAPKKFLVENQKLRGVVFTRVEWQPDAKGNLISRDLEDLTIECDAVILAVGQENAMPFIERDLGIDFDKWDVPVVDKSTYQSTRPGVFFGGDAAFGPKNIIWAVAHGHEAAISIHLHCQGLDVGKRPAPGMNLLSQKMGYHEWSYHNNYDPLKRLKVPHLNLAERFKALDLEVEIGFDVQAAAKEAQRCLNCDVQTVFTDASCIECDACIDICPLSCLTMTPNQPESELRHALTVPAINLSQDLFVSGPLKQTGRVMVKDEDLCIHCGLCAERCPTAAWDMQKFQLIQPHAGAK